MLEVGGVRFARVARPEPPEPGFPGVLLLQVDKHHQVLYRAGRRLEIMSFGDGFDYVPLVTGARGLGGSAGAQGSAAARVVPDGWSVRQLVLGRDLVVELPNPTRVAFLAGGDSFQGPLRLPL